MLKNKSRFSETITSNSFGQLKILWHDSNSLGVNGAKIGIFEERNKVGFCCFLKGQDSLTLESNFLLELNSDFTDKSLERQFADEKISLTYTIFTLFWNFLISLNATVPGLKRCGFLSPEAIGALLRAIFWATSCFLGTFCAVDFLAVCFVLAIFRLYYKYRSFQFRRAQINQFWLVIFRNMG